MTPHLNTTQTDDQVSRICLTKCERCENGQIVSYGKRLCDYGTQAIPCESMRHPLGMCGPQAVLFADVIMKRKYAEFD